MMSMKPWRKVATPTEYELSGAFQQAEFLADTSHVHAFGIIVRSVNSKPESTTRNAG